MRQERPSSSSVLTRCSVSLTHGYMNQKKRVSASSLFWESMPYYLDVNTGIVDYDYLSKLASSFRPKLIIAGATAYPRNYDYPRMRKAKSLCRAAAFVCAHGTFKIFLRRSLTTSART